MFRSTMSKFETSSKASITLRWPCSAFWQIAYHAVFFGHLYLFPDKASFRPWDQHQSNNQNEDGLPGTPEPKSSLPLIPEP